MTSYCDEYFTSPDGLKLFYRDYNVAPKGSLTVLCMPGLTRNSKDFEEIAAHLAPQYRVICAEQRGRGKSAWDPDPSRYRPDVYLADMMALLAHLGISEIVAFGTSLGGLMTMMMAAKHPGVIKAAIINDIGPELDPTGIARIKSYVGKGTPPATWDEAYANVKGFSVGVYPNFTEANWRWFTHKLYADKNGKPEISYDPAIGKTFDADNSDATPTPNFWPQFEALCGVPVVVLRGALSDLLSEETLAKMTRLHPDLVPITVPERGHTPFLNEPVCVSAIDALLEKA